MFFRKILLCEGYVFLYFFSVLGRIPLDKCVQCELHHIFVLYLGGFGECFVPICRGDAQAVRIDIRQMYVDDCPLLRVRTAFQQILQTVGRSRDGGGMYDGRN